MITVIIESTLIEQMLVMRKFGQDIKSKQPDSNVLE